MLLPSLGASPQRQVAPGSTDQQFLCGSVLQLLSPWSTSKLCELSVALTLDVENWERQASIILSMIQACIAAHTMLSKSLGRGKDSVVVSLLHLVK